MIQRALAQIPAPRFATIEYEPAVTRAKSFLLFYALRDRVGASNFQLAMQHMLSARRARGFDVTDLISALEEQSHQAVGPFPPPVAQASWCPGRFSCIVFTVWGPEKFRRNQEVAP